MENPNERRIAHSQVHIKRDRQTERERDKLSSAIVICSVVPVTSLVVAQLAVDSMTDRTYSDGYSCLAVAAAVEMDRISYRRH